MAKNVQLYDYTGTTKLYPTTVAQEVIYNDDPLSDFLSDCVSVDNDHEQRIYTLEQKVGNGVASDEDFINLQEEVNSLDSRITTLEEEGLKEIEDSSITTAKLANSAVTSSKIKDGEVEWDKLSVPVQMRIEDSETRITTLENNEGIPVIELTQAEYDSLDEYQFNTLYYITDGISVIDELMARVSALENL
jgi:hypothetical protein